MFFTSPDRRLRRPCSPGAPPSHDGRLARPTGAFLCARTVFVPGVITGQPWLAVGAALAATAIHEENILLLVWLLVFRRVGIAAGIAALAVAAAGCC